MSFAEAQDEWKLQPTWSCTQGLKKYFRFSCSGLLPTVGELSPQHPLFQRPTVLGDTPQDPDTASHPALWGQGYRCMFVGRVTLASRRIQLWANLLAWPEF